MNEAMSDIFGALVDRQEGANPVDTWLLGEDIYTPGTPGDALRYMADPTADGDSFDWYPTRYQGSSDYGGVHWNSGIANLAFVLLVEGGLHPRGKSCVNVTAIGFEAAADIFYNANVNCMTADSNFEDARRCTAVVFGGNYTDQVHLAWDAVGVPGGGGDGCPSGGGGGGGSSGGLTCQSSPPQYCSDTCDILVSEEDAQSGDCCGCSTTIYRGCGSPKPLCSSRWL